MMAETKGNDIEDPPTVEEETMKQDPEQAVEKATNNTNMNYNKKRILIVVTLLMLVLAAILIGVLVPKKKNRHTNNSSNSNTNNEESYQEKDVQFVESTDGLFDVKLPLFNPDNFGVYQDAGQASKDFDLMAKVVLNSVVERNMGVTYDNVGYGTGGGVAVEDGVAYASPVAAPTAEQDVAFAADASNAKGIGDDVQGWETNNQKEFVDRADIAKSDGKFVFAAFDDTIMVLRANKAQDSQNQIVTQLKMPEIPYEEPQPCYETTTCDDQGECTACDCNGNCYVTATSGATNSSSGGATEAVAAPSDAFTSTTKSMPISWWRPKAYIQAMSLAENRLMLVVSGYGYQIQQARTTPTCINDYLSTQIRLYNTEKLDTTGELELIGIQDIHGSFQEAYMIDNVVHLVTMAYVNTYEYLVSPIERYNEQYIGLDDDAYKAAVYNTSSSIIDKFATCLVDELSVTTGVFPTVARMAVMANDVPDDVSPALILPENFGSSIASITSLNIVDYSLDTEASAGADKEPRLQLHQTFQMMDSWWGWSYSAKDMIIIAAQGNDWNRDGGLMQGSTYLFGFLLDDVITMPYTSGMIPGTLVNEFALDYEDGVFRAATTSRIDIHNPVFGTPVAWVAVWDWDAYYGQPVSTGQAAPGNNMTADMVVEGISPANSTDKPTLSRMVSSCDEIDDCTDEVQTCQGMMEVGCTQVFYSPETCNMYCWDRYEGLVANSGCPKPGDACLGEDDFLECIEKSLDPMCSFSAQLDTCPYAFGFDCEARPPSYTSPCLRLPETDGCDRDQQQTECLSLESGGCTDIRVFDDCSLECFVPPASLTENYVYALIPNENKELEVSGKANIGLDNEQIFAVRFFKRMAYAVTFEQTDPLYVISFDDPLAPTVIGEVKVTGFSSYLHSINSDDTMLIGIGRDADAQGVVGGMQISLFDATDPRNPKVVTSYILDDAYSSAEWEEKSFRYVSLDEGEGTGSGILIVPMNKWSDENTYFDGFKVFTVSFNNAADTGSIVPMYDISHVEDTSMCYMCAYLQERSFVVNGDLITMKGRSVRSHDLDDGRLIWMVDLSGDGENCCQWWY